MKTRKTDWSLASVLCAGLVMASFSVPDAGAHDRKLDLKRFNLDEVNRDPDRWAIDGCSFTLWQSDQHPWNDKYPFVFVQSLEGVKEVPGYIQVGSQFIPMKRAASGGDDVGYTVHPFMLYRSLDGKTLAYMELALAEQNGESAEVESGTIRVMRTGHVPFTVNVVGTAGC
ncbi:hypothetical protein [Coralliovum pocilloporae]|uniref:hypothetical protein n=1 Tax=Coralliovum pocilloporae TaxID=3066369 RepID=UPI003306D0C3